MRSLSGQGNIVDKKASASGIICLQPFYFMEFTTDGMVYTCCPAWIKSPIGNIAKNSIAEIWNSKKARQIRMHMYRGEWEKICNPVCPRLSAYRREGTLVRYDDLDSLDFLTPDLSKEINNGNVSLKSSPTVFNLSNSKICNLSCIMCSRDAQTDDTALLMKTADDIVRHLPSARRIVMSGLGDPFVRPDTMRLLTGPRSQNPDLKFQIITNGLLLGQKWDKIKHHSFDTLLISVDAATKETYEKIRKGGKWERLSESLLVVKNNKDRFSSVTINMTVMRENYREIPDFIALAETYGFNVSFQRIRGTWGRQNIFELNDTGAIAELKEILANEQARKRSIFVFWGDLVEFGGNRSGVPDSKEDDIMAKEPLADGGLADNSLSDRQIGESTGEAEYHSDIATAPSQVLPLSVVICTFNRAELLRMTLASLEKQTLDRDKFEIIIIDDGSSDGTRECAESFADRLPIKYFFQRNAGLASAKNHGIFAARGKILFFMDDDDVAAPTLLEEHLKTHDKYPGENYAVLNYTAWSPDLAVTPLMHFATEVGCFLFYYPHIRHGDVLDYTCFWGGRSSCKRSFLIDHGVFNPVFRFGCEDIELGYRLSTHGLKVVYNRKAVSYMTRPVGFDDFCNRLIKQGRSQYVFSRLHDNRMVYEWAEINGAEERWQRIMDVYEAKRNSARGLDRLADAKLKLKVELDDTTRRLLYNAYWWVFRACKLKGIADARADSAAEGEGTSQPSSRVGGGVESPAYPQGISAEVMTSEQEYRQYLSLMKDEHTRRRDYEKSFISGTNPFSVKGRCYVCEKETGFLVDYAYSYRENGLLTPNWRENLVCPRCGLNNRMRAAIHLFGGFLQPGPDSRIYISEQTTALYKWFAANYRDVTGSEYLGNLVPFGGTGPSGIKNESMTELTFLDDTFDFILSFDVFEHIPDFQQAFRECFRVLKKDGMLFFTVPFDPASEKNIILAAKKDDGKIEHFFPPEYHGDPVNEKGCLAFYRFGWEMLGQLREAGFSRAQGHFYWSDAFGYLGDNQIVFMSRK